MNLVAENILHVDIGDTVEHDGCQWVVDDMFTYDDGSTVAILDRDGETDEIEAELHEYVDGYCSCGKACPSCFGEGFVVVDYHNPSNAYGHGQYETKCECSINHDE